MTIHWINLLWFLLVLIGGGIATTPLALPGWSAVVIGGLIGWFWPFKVFEFRRPPSTNIPKGK